MKSDTFAVRLFTFLFPVPILILGACSPPPPDSSFIHLVGSGTPIQKPGPVTSSATCPSGQQLIGGGFTADVAPGSVAVTENYPSSSNTWTVTAQAGQKTSGVLVAVAYCFTTPNVSLKLLTVTASTNTNPRTSSLPAQLEIVATGNAACPAGSVLMGGGYRSQGLDTDAAEAFNSYISAEGPSSNNTGQPVGWQTTLTYPNTVSPTATVFAICAGSYFAQGKTVTANTSLAGTQTADVHCPPNTFTSGGGYSLQQTSPTPFPYTVYSSFSDTKAGVISVAPNHRLDVYDASGWRSDLRAANTPFTPWALSMSASCIPFPK